jgi:AraC family transcriptional regulator
VIAAVPALRRPRIRATNCRVPGTPPDVSAYTLDLRRFQRQNEGLPYQPNEEPYRWLSVPRWYLWEGGFLLSARAQGVVPSHAHHAIQIVIALDGCVAVRGHDGDWRESGGIVVRADAEHSFDCNGALGVMVFVDPESSEGAWLSTSLRQDITIVPNTRLAAIATELRPFAERPHDIEDVGALVRHCVQGLRTGIAPTRGRDPRVTTVLDAIRSADDLRMSLEQAADKACLSPTRFAHLFRDQVGLPFRRYMLCRKLTRAMVAVASERTIAAAAHAADFADAAHLTRTFYQMVGMAPSVLMRGDFIEIASPFNLLQPGSARRPFPRPTE